MFVFRLSLLVSLCNLNFSKNIKMSSLMGHPYKLPHPTVWIFSKNNDLQWALFFRKYRPCSSNLKVTKKLVKDDKFPFRLTKTIGGRGVHRADAKLKVKVTIEQATRAQMGIKGIALLFLQPRRYMVGGWVVNVTPRPLYSPEKRLGAHCKEGRVGPRAGLERCGKSRPPTGIRSAHHSARSE
jgi:hypothetical protein